MVCRDSQTRVWRHANVLTMVGEGLGAIADGAIVATGDRIVWVGRDDDLPSALTVGAALTDLGGRLVLPGLIDCHTHLVFMGHRTNEFEMRLAGASYADIALAGGGIVSSVRGVRAATEAELLAQTLPRLDALLADGVTTVEVKSGYGLDLASERASLRVARRLGVERSVRVATTCLAAHAIPMEWRNDRSG